MRHLLFALGGLTLVLGFQNCSKVGVTEIPVGNKVLATEYVNTTPTIPNETNVPNVPSVPEIPADNNNDEVPVVDTETPKDPTLPDVPGTIDIVDNKPPKDDKPPKSDVIPDSKPPKSEPEICEKYPESDTVVPREVSDVTPENVAKAIAKCDDDAASSIVANLKLKFNHESLDVTSANVISVIGNHGDLVVIRAADENSRAQKLHFNHSTVVLCHFKSIDNIHSVHSKLIVVGGSIGQLKSTHSHVSLVNASVKKAKQSGSVLIGYSLK